MRWSVWIMMLLFLSSSVCGFVAVDNLRVGNEVSVNVFTLVVSCIGSFSAFAWLEHRAVIGCKVLETSWSMRQQLVKWQEEECER